MRDGICPFMSRKDGLVYCRASECMAWMGTDDKGFCFLIFPDPASNTRRPEDGK
jgi:hypothetical protein